MTMFFRQLGVGARFEFRGRRYEKIALSMAQDEERLGNVFHDQTEVCVERSAEHAGRSGVKEVRR